MSDSEITHAGTCADFEDTKSLWWFLVHTGMRLLKASYLLELRDAGGILPKQQQAPATAFLPLGGTCNETAYLDGAALRVLVVSHPWLSFAHPDPNGEHLRQICRFLEARPTLSAVFIDFTCLPQPDLEGHDGSQLVRSPQHEQGAHAFVAWTKAQEECLRKALANMHLLYAHDFTVVLRLDSPFSLPAVNPTPYERRAWCVSERRMSQLKAVASASVSHREISEATDGSRHACSAPMTPADFAEELRHLESATVDDKALLRELYALVFKVRAARTELLVCYGLPSRELQHLARALPFYSRLKGLRLSFHDQADASGIDALTSVFAAGGAADLQYLCCGSRYSTDGAANAAWLEKLAGVLEIGALPRLEVLVFVMTLGEGGAARLSETLWAGAAPSLKSLLCLTEGSTTCVRAAAQERGVRFAG